MQQDYRPSRWVHVDGELLPQPLNSVSVASCSNVGTFRTRGIMSVGLSHGQSLFIFLFLWLAILPVSLHTSVFWLKTGYSVGYKVAVLKVRPPPHPTSLGFAVAACCEFPFVSLLVSPCFHVCEMKASLVKFCPFINVNHLSHNRSNQRLLPWLWARINKSHSHPYYHSQGDTFPPEV